MTKKHFKAIADILGSAMLSDGAKYELACSFAEYFASEDPRFNKERFIQAVEDIL